DPRRLAAIVRRERATFLVLSTSVFNRHAHADCRVFDGVRVVMFGGEAASVPAVQALWDRGDLPEHLVNVYGPTENTILSTWFPILERPVDGAALPIGRPVPGTVCRVVGPDLAPVPDRESGELWVAGQGLARGYLGRPEITAERFVDHAGQRWYRTGDVVRALPTGDLVFIGRTDNQVKIQGVRIELEEIERLLERHPGVVQAQVVLERTAGSRRLVAYLVLAAERPSAAALRSFAMAALPAVMVPSVFRRIDVMPLKPSGKADRDALPGAVVEEIHLQDARLAPRDPLESRVHAVWARHLDVPPATLGVTCEFFASGGESLVAAAITGELGARLGVEIGMDDLLRNPTVAQLAEHIRSLPKLDPTPIPSVDDALAIPLSASQEQIWLHQLVAPGEVFYNEPFDVVIPEVVHPGRLELALASLVERHEVLRSRVRVVDGRPLQHFEGAGPVRLPFSDVRHLPPGEARAEALEIARRQALRPFDLADEPPVRFHLVQLGDRSFRLCVTAHHIAIDGVSIGRLFVPELRRAYVALGRGEAGPSALVPRYRDVVVARGTHADDEDLAWWKERLAGYAPVVLPTDRGVASSHAGGWAPLVVGSTLLDPLRRLAREEGTSLFHVLLAAWKTLLHRHSGQSDITVATVAWGRDRAGDDLHVGNFLNTLALRTEVPPDAAFIEVLRRTRATCDASLAHRRAPYQDVVRHALRGSTSRGGGPVQVGFGLEPPPAPCGWAVEPFTVQTGTTKLDLTLRLEAHDGSLVGGLEYRTGLFDTATAERLAAHYLALLDGVAR
ncbi:MAG: AMP-binding protein, partial [Myxococcales bacterium]|nr:AMP-binding protein [Myxococcales bacterium]